MGVRADDNVRTGLGQLLREALLGAARAGRALHAPVQVDDDHVCLGACGPDRLEHPRDVLGGGEPGLVRPSGPRRPDGVIKDLRGPDERHLCPPYREDLRPVRRFGVAPDPDDGKAGRAGRVEGVLQADLPVIDPVVVGLSHHLDAGAFEGGERRRGRAENELLACRRTPGGDRGLEVDHGEVGGGQTERIGPSAVAGSFASRPARTPWKWTSPPKDRVSSPLPVVGLRVGVADGLLGAWCDPLVSALVAGEEGRLRGVGEPPEQAARVTGRASAGAVSRRRNRGEGIRRRDPEAVERQGDCHRRLLGWAA